MKTSLLLSLVFAWLRFNRSQCQYIHHSVTLTPLNTSISGASITTSTIAKNISIASPPSKGWQIIATNQIGFHIHITLDYTWRFLSNTTSSLRLTINSNTSFNTPDDLEPITVFSMNSNQYITSIITADNNNPQENYIYPLCGTPTSPSNVATGDINANINQKIYSPNNRYNIVTNNRSETPWLPNNADDAKLNYFPIIYTLKNDPIANLLTLTHQNPTWRDDGNYHQECHFYPFATGDLDIYIAAEDEEEKFSITSIQLEFMTSDPFCENGITQYGINGNTNPACCRLSCGVCGGDGCNTFPGGKWNCCTSRIKSINASCDENVAPCVLSGMYFFCLLTEIFHYKH